MSKAVILLGDTTDHGGKVITAVDEYTHNGIPIAGKGDLVACLQCKGVFPIIQGADSLKYIPFIFQVAALLAAFTHPSHIVIYAPGDSFTCRRAATRNLLGIKGNLLRLKECKQLVGRN